MNRPVHHPRVAGRHRRSRGFTLIEAALTTVIVGTGVLAIVAAQQAYHAKNNWAQRTGTAMLLANEMRELTMSLPLVDPLDGSVAPRAGEDHVTKFNDLCDFSGPDGGGTSFAAADDSGPINALRQVITDMPGWRQHIRVEAVEDHYISSTYSLPLTSNNVNVMRVTVTVFYQSESMPQEEAVTELSWIVTRR